MITRANLSVCIIAKNEEKMLTDCLESVKDVANEIILVDTGSTDSTLEVAEKYNCRIINSSWQNDFSKARNISLNAAKNPYILCIDADERLTNPELLSETLTHSSSNVGGWLLQITSVAKRHDGSIDTYISNLLRLFISHPKIRFSGIIHEQIIEPILKLGYKLENSQLKLTHLGYSYSHEQMYHKQLRNLELLNVCLSANSEDAYAYYQRA
jgi:glycosyltransferase involved in cell wall biosynthesis